MPAGLEKVRGGQYILDWMLGMFSDRDNKNYCIWKGNQDQQLLKLYHVIMSYGPGEYNKNIYNKGDN